MRINFLYWKKLFINVHFCFVNLLFIICSMVWRPWCTLREKVPKYGAFSGPYFPAFVLNTEIYGVNICVQSECGKILTRKNSLVVHFTRIGFFWENLCFSVTLTIFNVENVISFCYINKYIYLLQRKRWLLRPCSHHIL